MFICSDCGKELKNKRALNGHLWLAHRKRTGWKWELEQEVARLKNLYNSLVENYNALVSQNQVLKLERERVVGEATKPNVVQIGGFGYKWKYCPECGQPKEKHRRVHDLILGDYWECPGGGKYKEGQVIK